MDKPDSLLPRKPGLVVIAWVHIVVAIGLTVLLVVVHFLQYWGSIDLVPLLFEAVLWIIPIVLLMVIGLGLLGRRSWGRLLALVFLWPVCVGSIGACVFIIFFGFIIQPLGMFSALAAIVVAVLFSIAFVSVWVLSYLHKRVGCRKTQNIGQGSKQAAFHIPSSFDDAPDNVILALLPSCIDRMADI